VLKINIFVKLTRREYKMGTIWT